MIFKNDEQKKNYLAPNLNVVKFEDDVCTNDAIRTSNETGLAWDYDIPENVFDQWV